MLSKPEASCSLLVATRSSGVYETLVVRFTPAGSSVVPVVREAASTWYCVTVAPLPVVRWTRLAAAS